MALGAFLLVALAASTVAEAARSRAQEAEDRRREADLAAELARVLLGGGDLETALGRGRPAAGGGDRRGLGGDRTCAAAHAERAPDRDPAPRRRAADRRARAPGRAAARPAPRVHERIVPALESILAAALARERLQAEVVETEALRRSDELKTALLRAVSHDLRTPITAILASAAALGSASLDDDERAEVVGGISESAERLSQLIDKLLDLSRLQSGTAGPAPRLVLRRRGADRGRRARPARALRRSPSRSTAGCRSCAPMLHSSSGHSRTCWRTRRATPAASRSRCARGPSAAGCSCGSSIRVPGSRRASTSGSSSRSTARPRFLGARAARGSASRSRRASWRQTAAGSRSSRFPGRGRASSIELPIEAVPEQDAPPAAPVPV